MGLLKSPFSQFLRTSNDAEGTSVSTGWPIRRLMVCSDHIMLRHCACTRARRTSEKAFPSSGLFLAAAECARNLLANRSSSGRNTVLVCSCLKIMSLTLSERFRSLMSLHPHRRSNSPWRPSTRARVGAFLLVVVKLPECHNDISQVGLMDIVDQAIRELVLHGPRFRESKAFVEGAIYGVVPHK
jgi:hypothetical protein